MLQPLTLPIRLLAGLLWLLVLAAPAARALPLPRRLPPAAGQLVSGANHSLLLRPNGTIYAWGYNGYGQLGNGSTTDSPTPVAMSLGAAPAGTRFVQVAAGNCHSLALAANGTLYAWGRNNNGQLGNGSTTDSPTPVAVSLGAAPTGTRFVQVATGSDHSLAVAADGTVYAWGYNGFSQLGDGGGPTRTTPVAVNQGAAPAGTRFVQVAGGTNHTVALAADGTLYAWGRNTIGQVGNGTNTTAFTPVAVSQGAAPTGTRFVQIAVGMSCSLALAADGSLYAWGANAFGQLGNGSTASSNVPVAVSLGAAPAGTRFAQMAAGGYYSLAVAADGTRYAWGRNYIGQLGNGSTTDSSTPVAVSQGAAPTGTCFAQVAAGDSHSLALAADGSLYAWGRNSNNQLGDGSTTDSSTPVAALAPAATGYQQAAGGFTHSLGLRADGALYAWGQNNFGQLGNNSTTDSPTPVAVDLSALPPGACFAQVAAGFNHALGLAADGTVYAWGRNNTGQLGNGSNTNSAVAGAVSLGAAPAGTRFEQVAAGSTHSLALAADGTVYAWGANGNGQLGNGSNFNSLTPVAVSLGAAPTGTRFVQVAAGNAHSLALAADGTLYAWGQNGNGQLGTGNNTSSNAPVAVSLGAAPVGTRFVQVACGYAHSLALAADGTLYAWGQNGNGQLGTGNNTSSNAPVAVSLGAAPVGTRFVQVACGYAHSLALAADGTLYTWGSNVFGQLGTGTFADSNAPVAVSQGAAPTGTRFGQVVGGYYHTLALAADGTLYAWGYNSYGQLGDNSTTTRPAPVVESSGRTDWRSLAACPTAYHSLVLGTNAGVFTAGNNNYGQLGDNTTTNSPIFLRNLAPLPVQLTSFAARRASAGTVQLSWVTASETNNVGFGIERSLDGRAFTHLGFVAGAGSSLTTRHYAYTDVDGRSAAYYRLAQTDLDGHLSYSAVQYVPGAGAGLSLYPNPTQGGAAVLYGAQSGAAVQVLDALGRCVATATANAEGNAVVGGGLAPGLYVLRCGSARLRLVVE